MKKSKGFFIIAGIFALLSIFVSPIFNPGVMISLIIAFINLRKEKKQNDATTTN